MATFDNFYGRIKATTPGSTDTYQETLITAPAVLPYSGSGNQLWIPVIKQVDFQFEAGSNNISGLSADSKLRMALMAGDTSLYTTYPSLGIADPNIIALAELANCLTTSGEIIFNTVQSVVLPGEGLIMTAAYMTLIMLNISSGVSIGGACQIWYDYLLMDANTYMRAIHGLNV